MHKICLEVYSETSCKPSSKKRIKDAINTLLNYSDVFFSKGVILCEGKTDFGAIPTIASKLGYNLDKYGITLLKVDGSGNLPLYLSILKMFKINTYSIIDADKKEDYGNLPNISFLGEDSTRNGAFELEFYKNTPHYKIYKILDFIYPSRSRDRIEQIKEIIPDFEGFNNLNETSEELLNKYKENSKYRKLVLKFMKKEKDTYFGKALAEELDPSEIPPIFKEAFENAIKLTEEKYGEY